MSNITSIKTSKGDFLFVEVPEYATEFQIMGMGRSVLEHKFKNSLLWQLTKVIDGEYKLIATTDSITEEQAAEIVERVVALELPKGKSYCHYGNDAEAVGNALDSLTTLLQHRSLTSRYAILKRHSN